MTKKKRNTISGIIGLVALGIMSLLPFVFGRPDTSYENVAGEFISQYGEPEEKETTLTENFKIITLQWPLKGVRVVLKKDISIKGDEGWSVTSVVTGPSPLFLAVKNGNIKKIEEIINSGVDINMYNHEGVTPLMYAVDYGKIKTVEWLIDHGAQVNRGGNWDPGAPNPLEIAAKENKTEIMDVLLENGANPNPETIRNYSLLYKALFFSSYEAAEKLIQHGTEVEPKEIDLIFEQKQYRTFKERFGSYLLQWSRENNRQDIINILKKHGIVSS
jgi:hypothetical protein